MKNLLFLLGVILLIAAMSGEGYAEYTTMGQSADSPSGGGSSHSSFYNDDEAFSIGTYVGSGVYTVPIAIPPGTNGLQPALTLRYNSLAAGSHGSKVGMGWKLTSNFIQRDMEATPNNWTDDSFDLIFNGAGYNLFYNDTEDRYHTGTESYLNITLKNSTNNTLGLHWLVITPDGTKYRFGHEKDSEKTAHNFSNALIWYLDLVEDGHGNKVYYQYAETPTINDTRATYLKNITYNSDKKRFIKFTYENRPDHIVSFNLGSEVLNSRRLAGIEVYYDGDLVRRYALSYASYPYSEISLLSSMTRYGSDNTLSLPSVRFSYQTSVIDLSNETSIALDNIPIFVKDQSGTMMNYGVTLADVNGDGLGDIVQSYINDSGVLKELLINNGNGWQNSSWNLTNIPIFYADDDHGGRDYGARIIDVNGDGLQDILSVNSSNRLLLLNNGSGWVDATNWTLDNLPSFTNYGSAGSYDNGVRFLDANGDGLIDILRSYDSTRSLLLNDGSKWTESGWDISNVPMFTKSTTYASEDRGVKILDANGDGLPDIIQKYDNDGSTSETFLINNGSGWTDYSFDISALPVFTKKVSGNSYGQGVFSMDLNTDGLTDLLQSYDNGTVTKKAFINSGSGWTEESLNLSSIPSIMKKGKGTWGHLFGDIDGDGITDLLHSFIDTTGVIKKSALLNNVSRGGLLSSVNNSIGGFINFTYSPSSEFDNTGGDGISDLPYVRWVLRNITEDNGMTGRHKTLTTATLDYADGAYNFFEKEFRGFGYVKTNRPDGSISENWFHQDTARQGRAYKTLISNSTGSPYHKTENNWLYSQTGNYNATYLNATTTFTYDGETSDPRQTQVLYAYDDYGNTIRAEISGDLNITGDEKYRYTDYSVNEGAWILRKPYRTRIEDSNHQVVSEARNYYDEQDYAASPALGDLTGVQNWLGGSSYTSANLTYDSYGNVNSTTDTLGYTSYFTYDAGTGTFPVTSTNPLGHVTSSAYDFGTGSVLNNTDPSGIVVLYEYDTFGRISKEILPNDTNESPTRFYEYYFNGGAPESVKVTQKASPSYYTHTFTDGLGRTVQTRRPAEDPSLEITQNTFYDVMGRANKTSVPYYSSVPSYYPIHLHYTEPAETYSMTTEYDPLGRVASVVNTDGTTKTVSYDHWNTTYTDETGSQMKQVLDAYGRITRVLEYNGTDIFITAYSYDSRDNLVNITDNEGNVFLFTYDVLGRKTSMVDPDLGTWNYTYDDGGNLISQRDNKSAVTNFTYDDLDRLNQTVIDGALTYTYSYDAQYNGTLSRISNPHDTYTYEYDNRLRKELENHSIEGLPINFTTTWTYDSSGRVTSITYPNGETISFTYNTQGQLESAGNYLTNTDYNAVEKITKKRFGDGVNTHYEYRPDNYRLSRIHTPTFQDFTYTYDGVGNVLTIGNQLRGTTENFGYDDLHRLTSAYETGGYNLTYAYNSIGNLMNIRDDVLVYGVGAGPHAVTSYQDVTPPQVSFSEDFRYNDSYSNEDSPTITAALNDNFGNATASLHWYNGSWNTISMTPASGTLATVPMSDLVDGSYQYYVTVDDSAGNSDTTDTRTINIDTVPPEISLTSVLDNSTINTIYVHIDGSAAEPVSGWTYSRGGSERVPFDFNYLLRYRRGDNALSILAQDRAGNLGWNTSRFLVNVTPLESDPPEIRIFSPAATYSPGGNMTVYILIVNYNDEEFMDGLRITVKDPTGMSQERTWQRIWLLGKDVYKIRYEYPLPEDAMTGQWLIRAEFSEDARKYASATSTWIEVTP